MKRSRINYYNYTKSSDWYAKHEKWLSAVGNHCTMFPWVKIGKKHPYAMHHMNYKDLGKERLGKDIVFLCPFAHDYVIHGFLSGFKSAGKQRNYPNLMQRLVHLWCVQRLWVKGLAIAIIIWQLVRVALN